LMPTTEGPSYSATEAMVEVISSSALMMCAVSPGIVACYLQNTSNDLRLQAVSPPEV